MNYLLVALALSTAPSAGDDPRTIPVLEPIVVEAPPVGGNPYCGYVKGPSALDPGATAAVFKALARVLLDPPSPWNPPPPRIYVAFGSFGGKGYSDPPPHMLVEQPLDHVEFVPVSEHPCYSWSFGDAWLLRFDWRAHDRVEIVLEDGHSGGHTDYRVTAQWSAGIWELCVHPIVAYSCGVGGMYCPNRHFQPDIDHGGLFGIVGFNRGF